MGSTKADVEVSYDVSNEFFRLWLDERMNYTSAVYSTMEQTGPMAPSEEGVSLEKAQQNKLHILSEMARVTPDKTVLDIGCGTGALFPHLTGVAYVGVDANERYLARARARFLRRAARTRCEVSARALIAASRR